MQQEKEKPTLTLLRADQMSADNIVAFIEKVTGEKITPEGRARAEALAARIMAKKTIK